MQVFCSGEWWNSAIQKVGCFIENLSINNLLTLFLRCDTPKPRKAGKSWVSVSQLPTPTMWSKKSSGWTAPHGRSWNCIRQSLIPPRVPISPRNTRNPAGSPANKQSPTLNICFSVLTKHGRMQRRCWAWGFLCYISVLKCCRHNKTVDYWRPIWYSMALHNTQNSSTFFWKSVSKPSWWSSRKSFLKSKSSCVPWKKKVI